MKWNKIGRIFLPDGAQSWARSHAMVPVPVLMNSDVLRVYFTSCDPDFRGRPGFFEVDVSSPTDIIRVSSGPILDVGHPGSFDEHGIVACSVIRKDEYTHFLYYAGFERGLKNRYRILTGLAISEDGGETFHKYKETPVLERQPGEILFRCGPFVLSDGVYKMWYISGSEWITVNGKDMPVYNIKYIESEDGIDWSSPPETCLDISDPDEHGFGRPWVVKLPRDSYELYYSIRKKSLAAYRLGFARSDDGRRWVRDDDALGLDISVEGYDNKAIMYSAVVVLNGKTYCFYNGNNFGKDGILLAERHG